MSTDETPIRQAILSAVGCRDVGAISTLASAYRAAGIETIEDLANATPQQVETIGTTQLNGRMIDLSKLLLAHHNRQHENLQEKPPPTDDK